MKNLFVLLHCWAGISFFSFSSGQQVNADLEDYYPSEIENPLEIKIFIHVFHYKKEDPKNFVEADTTIIQQHMENVNAFYSTFDKPTLKAENDSEIPFFYDSKIRFKVEKIEFIVDSVSWERWKRELNTSGGFPKEIQFLDTVTNTIGVTGANYQLFKKTVDSITILNSSLNNGGYHIDSAWSEKRDMDGKMKNVTFLRLKGKKLMMADSLGSFSYLVDKSRNCDRDIWENVLHQNKDYIHILATGSHYDQGFGCGPSPYFLNTTNWGPVYRWAGSQLIAHEIGHCLGLNHTDYPQFDDLPKKDKFGWYMCDSVEVSNNIMGYNVCRRYLSPKQIAYIHKLYSSDPARIRTTTKCEYLSEETQIFRTNKEIKKHTVFQGDIIVKKNKTLTLTKSCYLTQNSTIYLEKNAELVLDDALVGSACQNGWKGIVKCKKVKKGKPVGTGNGKITFKNGGRVVDTANY